MHLSINYLAYRFIKEDGYGRFGMHQVRALSQLGADVYPYTMDTYQNMPDWMLRLQGWDFNRLTLALMPGCEMRGVPGRQWGYSMYESTSLPKGWADSINALCERLLVPTQWCADVFRDNGVRDMPIHIVPGGVDPHEFPILAPSRVGRPYTFLCLGDRGTRKGWDVVLQAFNKAFRDIPDTRLIVKIRGWGGNNVLESMNNANSPDPLVRRFHIWRADVDSMADVFAHADCFVFPTRAEGEGMPPREAACMGLPVICTRYSGTAADIDQWGIPLEKYKLGKAAIEGGGQWANPDVDEVAEKMLWCYRNRDEARAKGLQAAAWLRANYTWQHSAQKLIDLVEQWG